MSVRHLWRINLALTLLGTVIAGAWIRMVGGVNDLTAVLRAEPLHVALMLGLTAACVVLRFVRWQFLMRHAGARLPVRPSLLIYLASLVGTATPAYLGEAIRAAFIRRKFSVPVKTTLFVLVIERLFDVAALACLAALTADTWTVRGVMVLVLAATVVAMLLVQIIGRAFAVPEMALAAMRRPDILRDTALMSLTAWFVAAFHISLAASSLGFSITPLAGVRMFSNAVLFGGLTLMPAGIGATGSFALLQLEQAGVSLSDSISIVALLRLTTVVATLLVGAVCFFVAIRQTRRGHSADAAEHFDDIAQEYGEQFKPHVWGHLLARKVGFIASALADGSIRGRGLDLGCGLGVQCLALEARGYRVFGMDVSQQLVRRARQAGAAVTAGSALALPFRDGSLDFVYAVGVLHHLPDRQAQQAAIREVARVLRPGGRFLVHETSTRNPLFRLYMGYVFPLLKKIDEGTEWWIEPWQWNRIPGLRLAEIQFFTFMPDFVPAWMMKPFLAIDRWLEASHWRSYAVHYMAVMDRVPAWTGVDGQGLVQENPRVPSTQRLSPVQPAGN